jgi:ParB-like chromosome segregation protein Spo0J
MKLVKINEVKPNPKNPRIIKDGKFHQLVKSIQEFPDMLNKRPLIVFTDVDGKYVVLGGNMRLKALKELNYKEVPVIVADEWTEEQKTEFLIKDNVGYGEWDWDSLANEWEAEKLEEWGLEISGFAQLPSEDELIGVEKNKPPTMKITFESVEDLQQAEIDIRELIDRKFPKSYFSVSAGEI